MSDAKNGSKNLSADLVAAIRKQAISEVSKYAILAFVVLIGIAGSGWWFYLQQKLDEYIRTHTAGVPSAAVVAIDSPSGCPDGWSRFDDAGGRTVIGVTSTNGVASHGYRATGGEETHQLKVAELPPLKFSFAVNAAENAGGDRYNAGGKDYPVVVKVPMTVSSNSLGGGDAYSTMPPYIALFYCKKK